MAKGEWRTMPNGAHVLISNKKKISKKEYGRLAHLIDSNPRKWKIGRNLQTIGNKTYFFNYKGYNDYDIIKVKKGK